MGSHLSKNLLANTLSHVHKPYEAAHLQQPSCSSKTQDSFFADLADLKPYFITNSRPFRTSQADLSPLSKYGEIQERHRMLLHHCLGSRTDLPSP